MDYVILDLEWNGSYSKKLGGYLNEIIEIGAIRLDEGLEVKNSFTALIRPCITKKLCTPVKTLTSLTYEELSKGLPFLYAYKRLSSFAKDAVIMTWSRSDLDVLISNLRFHKGDPRIRFMKKYLDLQEYIRDMLSDSCSNSPGLRTAAEILDIDISGSDIHRALEDCILSAKCLEKLYDKEKLEAHILDADEEFYKRMFFRPYLVYDIDSEDVDKSQMYFDCDICKGATLQRSKWKVVNKGFHAEFFCEDCQRTFTGRITFKRKYDSVAVTKKILGTKQEKEALAEKGNRE